MDNFPSQAWKRQVAQFLFGQTVTLFGSSLVQYAISWHITLTTQSGKMLTIATLCGFLPQVVVSLFAGVWADRYNRKLLIALSDSMIAICTAMLAVCFAIGYDPIWLLFVISAIRSLGAGIQSPAVSAFLPELVPQEHLLRVNGINASIMSGMMLLAPAVASQLYGLFGLGPVFWVDIATAGIGIALLLNIKTAPREKPAREPEHIFREMFSGMRYVASQPWLYQLMGFYLIFALMFGPVVFLTPLMVARSFGPEPWRLMAHEMVFSLGSILGGVLVGIWGGFRNKTRTLIAASAAFGLTTFVMGFSTNFWFYLGVMLPMGLTMPFINTGSMTILQTRTKPELMGRVFGLVSIMGSGAMPLSMAVFGPLADAISVESQLIITGALMVVIALFAIKCKAMYEAGEPLPPPQEGQAVMEE